MQEMNDIPMPQKRPSALREAVQCASCVLRGGERLTALVITYLFCALALFSLSFAVQAIGFFFLVSTPLGLLLLDAARYTLGTVAFVLLLLPLFAGRARMAGMVASGKEPPLSELFHYFSSWRLWWRGVRIALLYPLALLLPPAFAAPALAAGNEEMPLSRALSLSVGRVPILAVLAF